MIGDPKQAIYAFRGADVYSYLDAVRQADQVRTLGTNWRSDDALVAGLDVLWGGAKLGDEQIVVRPVRAHQRAAPVDGARRRGSDDGSDQAALPAPRRRCGPGVNGGSATTADHPRSGGRRHRGAGLGPATGARRARPAPGAAGRLAVLVRKNERGEAIREALVAAGVPAVMHGASSVFASTMAQDWLTLLSALEQPRQQAVRQAALTCFFGWDFVRLAEAGDAELTELSQRVRGWSRLLAGRGVAALLEAAITEERVPERLLREVGGEPAG